MITTAEYAARRDRVLESLNGAVGIVYAGEGSHPVVGVWRPDLDFQYLTGITTEPGAAVLFNPSADDPDARITLFLKPVDPELDRWDGFRDMVSKSMKASLGFATVRRTSSFQNILTTACRRTKRAACLHSFSTTPGRVSPDLTTFRAIGERIPGVAIEDRTMLLPGMRAVKSKAEIGFMRKAAAFTAAGYTAALHTIRPGANESDVQIAMESAYVNAGADRTSPGGVAYGSIVGGGINATVLHYHTNNAPLKSGDLLLIDSGAQCAGYACDVTRTFPVNGKFSSDHADLYELVLKAQSAAIKACRPGVHMFKVDAAAREVFDKAGMLDFYIHSIGHQLGLNVHDSTPDGPLKPGMVVTIEPGLYLPERKVGIRIEDDILITKSAGGENLTRAIPKTIREIEAAMNAKKHR